MKDKDNKKKAVEEFIRKIKGEYGDKIEKIILFGSYARGDYRGESDVDIIVLWTGDEEEGWRVTTKTAFNVLLNTGEYISIKIISPGDMEKDNIFIKNVLEDGIAYA